MSDEEKLKKIKEARDEALRKIDETVAWHKAQLAEVTRELEAERIAQLRAKLEQE